MYTHINIFIYIYIYVYIYMYVYKSIFSGIVQYLFNLKETVHTE
jgi:hypothetical protein